MNQRSCVDKYGNLAEGLKAGAVVESDIAIFTVGEINSKTTDCFVFMDKDKPYKIKDESHPMAKCVRSGHYGVIAPCLVFSELPPTGIKGNDLISREKVLEIIRPRLNASADGTLEHQHLRSILISVEGLPAAYGEIYHEKL